MMEKEKFMKWLMDYIESNEAIIGKFDPIKFSQEAKDSDTLQRRIKVMSCRTVYKILQDAE